MTAIIGGLLAAACFASATLAAARSSRMIGALPTLAGVILVSAALAIPAVALTVGDSRPPLGALPLLAISGLGNVLGLGFVYVGLRSGKVGLVASLASAEGAVAAVLAMLGGERLAVVETAGVAIVALGVTCAAFAPDPSPASGQGPTHRAVIFGGLAGLAFGASLYATGRLGAELALGWAIVAPRVAGLVLIVIPLAATARLRVTRAALPFVLVAGAGEFGGFLAFAWGAVGSIAVSSALAAQFASVAAIVAWLVLGERLGRLQWAGVAAVAIGVVLLALGAV